MELKGTLGEQLLFSLVGIVGRWILGLYFSTIRIVNDPHSLGMLNRAPSPRGIFALWHQNVLLAMWHHRRTRSAILISPSREGEFAARVASSLGYHVLRGSPTRGGAAGMRELLRVARSGSHGISITPDGSHGPRHSVKHGVIMLAQRSGRPIAPLVIGLSKYWALNTWDRFRIPKPFARGINLFGEPLTIPPDAGGAQLAELTRELRARMIALQDDADRRALAMR